MKIFFPFSVQMHCEATTMTAIVKVITPFRGRLYALGHPYECYTVDVRANGDVALKMPLHGRTCGTKNLVSILQFGIIYLGKE